MRRISVRLQVAAMGQREMRGAIRNRKSGSGDEIHRRRDRHHRGSVGRDLLGVTAARAQHREDAFSYPQVAGRPAPASHRRFVRHRLAAEIDPDKTPHGQRIHADPGSPIA